MPTSATDAAPATRRDHGFTLVELLVVVVVMGILAAIAVPTFLSQRQKARDTAVEEDMRALVTELVTAQVDGAAYPTPSQLHDAGTDLKTSPTVAETVLWATATDFCVVATSTDGSPDTSGLGSYVGITTRIFAQSSTSGPLQVTATDHGCVDSATSPPTDGWFGSDGYHAGAIGS